MTESEFDPHNDVVTMLRVYLNGDRRHVIRLASDWTQAHLDALAVWALETHSQRFTVYRRLHSPEVPEGMSGAVLQVLSLLKGGSPPLVAKYIFLTL